MKCLQVKKLRPQARLPQRQTSGSAGYDLHACLDSAVTILPGQRDVIPTGIAVELPGDDCVGLVFGRSGLGVKYGIMPSNAVGVIDSDYRGEIQVALSNFSLEPYTVFPGDRIAQLVIVPCYTPRIEEVSGLSESERGNGGFGSTGK